MKKLMVLIMLVSAGQFLCCSGDPDSGEGPPSGPDTNSDPLVINHTSADISLIPESAINLAKKNLHIAYNHTSHGSQIITGMNALADFPLFEGLYAWGKGGDDDTLDLADSGIPSPVPDLSQGDYVDATGDTPWVTATRAFLDATENSTVNVIMWSWCSINGHDARRYVNNMEKLVEEYPDVAFVFMTGHAEGDSDDLTENGVHYNNELIRKHCRDHKRVLYDFALIESYDPDGNYYWDRAMYDNLAYDGSKNWGAEWIAANPDSTLALLTTGIGVDGYDGCSGCAHSDSPQEANLNCILKAQAAWRLFAELAGWDGP